MDAKARWRLVGLGIWAPETPLTVGAFDGAGGGAAALVGVPDIISKLFKIGRSSSAARDGD